MHQAIHEKAFKETQEVDQLSMPNSQSSEIAEAVQTTTHNTKQGQHQLQQIFSEADQSGEGRGRVIER